MDITKFALFSYEEKNKYLLKKEDLLICEGGDVGRCAIWESNNEMYFQNALHRVRFLKNINPRFFLYVLNFYKGIKLIEKVSKGVTIKHFVQSSLFSLYFPLPPLEEQKRIVEKIEELEPLIEEYKKAEEQLYELNSNIKDRLKKSILQYAIEGKLVEQNPDDEPASVLLERIRNEKNKLIAEGKLKKDKNESVIFRRDNSYYEQIGKEERCIDDELPFEIPDSWMWSRLGSLLKKLTDGTHSTPKYKTDGVPFISVKDISSGKIDFSNTKFISSEDHKVLYKRCNPEKGDILLSKVGTTGIPVLVDSDITFSLFVSVALLKFSQKYLNANFLVNLLKSPLVQQQCQNNTKGVGNKNWVMRDIANTLLAIPPLEEQKRIVKSLNNILKILD